LIKNRWKLAGLGAVAALAVALIAWSQVGANRSGAPMRIVAVYPHDPNAFTQGLVVHDGMLLEGTGQYGRSSLRRVAIETGEIELQQPLNAAYFGEGITVLGDRVYQLTWKSHTGFVYDVDTFALERTFKFPSEGWGLTTDGKLLVQSDGTAMLRYLDPETFAVVRTLTVRDGDRPIERLNELEWVDGEIWSNVWYDDRIARIDPDTGTLIAWIDLSNLLPPSERGGEDVLNGIAYDPTSKRLFVTGKDWPKLFEIEVRR
jgi:glutamine cyclotransferase